MVFVSVAISVRCAKFIGIECFLQRKNISDVTETTRKKKQKITIHDDDAFRYVTWRYVSQTMTS